MNKESSDLETAQAFSTSWNNLPVGSVYTKEQVLDWMAPLQPNDFKDKEILEMGCGGGNLMIHVLEFEPKLLKGIDLGDSVIAAQNNLSRLKNKNWSIAQEDLTSFTSSGSDIVYCIGVLHHMKEPHEGFLSVVRNTKPGGSFHCWVYAHEGNAIVRTLVEPIRKISSNLPWMVTKYLIATPLSFIYFLYAKLICMMPKTAKYLPLGEYSLWIGKRNFLFFRHVAFDQLVTPQTQYIKKEQIHSWLKNHEQINQNSTYIIQRNANSWKFGGKKI